MRERFRNWMRTPSLRGQLIWLSVSSVLVTLLISLLIAQNEKQLPKELQQK